MTLTVDRMVYMCSIVFKSDGRVLRNRRILRLYISELNAFYAQNVKWIFCIFKKNGQTEIYLLLLVIINAGIFV